MSAVRKAHNCLQASVEALREREWRSAVADARQYARDHADEIEAEWNALDGRTASQQARDEWRAKSPEERRRRNQEWEG